MTDIYPEPIMPYDPADAGQEAQLPLAYADTADVGAEVSQLQRTVIDESAPVSRAGYVAAGVALAVVVAGGWYAYDRWGKDASTVQPVPPVAAGALPETAADPGPGPEDCTSPAVEKTFKGDPGSTVDDPETWKHGVLVAIKPPKDAGYHGTIIGFHAPGENLDGTTWSAPLTADELSASPALMRTGLEDYTIVVENTAEVGSVVCNVPPKLTFKLTSVKAALRTGAIEPAY